MQLPHPRNNGLVGIRINADLKSGVLLKKLDEAVREFVLLGLGLGLNGNGDNRLRKLYCLKNNRLILIAKRISGIGFLQPNNCGNITCPHRVHFLPLIRMHP